jgi:hypothetical protein
MNGACAASPLIRQWRLTGERRFGYRFHRCPILFLEVFDGFDQWRANRKYNREPIPDHLRDAALEISRRYPSSLLRQVLKIQLCRLMPKAKTNARRSNSVIVIHTFR